MNRSVHCAGAFLFLAIASGTALGQQYQLRHYGVADGLAHGVVQSIYQDSKGYIWFGTREGLSRFDGYSFVNYGEREGLTQELVNDVTQDKQDRVWVATNGAGVALFLDDGRVKSAGKFKTFLIVKNAEEAEPKRGANAVNRILCDSQDNLWALTDAGLFRAPLSDPDLKFEAIKTDPLPESSAAFKDSSGRLWFGYGKELLELRDGQLINHGAIAGQHIRSISQDSGGRILVAVEHLLYEFVLSDAQGQSGEWRKIEVKLKPNQGIYSLLADSAGDLYVGTTSGVIERRRDGQLTEINSQVLGPYTVWVLAEDRDRNVWISAWANGVYKLSGEAVANYTDAEGRYPRAADIFEEGGVLKAVVFGGKVVQFSNGPIKYSAALEYPPTIGYSVTVWRDKQEWWSYRLGGHYAKFRKPIIRFHNGRELPLTAIASLEELSKGVSYYEDENGKLWVKKGDGKIYCGRFTQSNRPALERLAAEFQEVGYGSQMISDRAGGIWIGTAERLCRIRQGEISCLQQTSGLPEIDPRSLFVDSRGWLWIGHRHRGVSVTKEPGAETPSFINYSTKNGLLSDSAWALTEDDEGRVYVGTGKGLSRFDPRNNTWQGFTSKDGLVGDDIKAFYKDNQGNIWIAAGGITRFNPRAERKASQPTPIYISRVNITGEDLGLPETGAAMVTPMQLAPSRNNVTIDFVGVQFEGEDTLLYQHKLEGADADWSAPTKLRSVNYASLSPGAYRFQVRAVSRDGLVSPPAVFDFRILSPIYLRWWFIALAVLLASAMATSIYRFRVHQLLELERVRMRIATDLHDDIGSSLSQVSVLSEVIRRRLGPDPTVSEPLKMIAGLSRDLVDSMNDIVWAINPRRDHLSDLTQRMRRFASDVFTAREIDFNFSTPESHQHLRLGADVRREVFLIFKESINNMVRHSACTKADIEFVLEDGWLELKLRDNGRGFDPELVEEGHGLASMRQRASKLSGELDISSNNEHGTTVKLRAPVGRRSWLRT